MQLISLWHIERTVAIKLVAQGWNFLLKRNSEYYWQIKCIGVCGVMYKNNMCSIYTLAYKNIAAYNFLYYFLYWLLKQKILWVFYICQCALNFWFLLFLVLYVESADLFLCTDWNFIYQTILLYENSTCFFIVITNKIP